MKYASAAQINEINILASKAGFASAREAISACGFGQRTPGQLSRKEVGETKLKLEEAVKLRTAKPEPADILEYAPAA